MRHLLAVVVTAVLLSLPFAPAEAKPKPLPQGCTFFKGTTTCVETTQTTEPGPQDGQVCTTSQGLPGTYSQQRTTTTTTTRTYSGRGTSAPPKTTRTTTSHSDGPATCEADSVVDGTLTLVPDPSREIHHGPNCCYDVVGTGLDPNSSVHGYWFFRERETGRTGWFDGALSPSFGSDSFVKEDGTFSYALNFDCVDYDIWDAYVHGTGADGEPVRSATMDPCEPTL